MKSEPIAAWHPKATKRVRLTEVAFGRIVRAAGGLSLPIIGALLGHIQPVTTARYAQLAADPLKQAAKIAGGCIAAALKKKS